LRYGLEIKIVSNAIFFMLQKKLKKRWAELLKRNTVAAFNNTGEE
jgi:hypothetical protein